MTEERCKCSNSRCTPLCSYCLSLADLVLKIRGCLRRYACSYGVFLTKDDIDELAGDVWVSFLRSGHSPDQLSGLIGCIAECRIIDRIRKCAPRGQRELTDELIAELTSRSELSDLALSVVEAMDRMPLGTRKVFHARGIERRTLKETAELLGLSLHDIRVLYQHAIRMVAEVLGLDDFDKELFPQQKKLPPTILSSEQTNGRC